MKKQIFANIPLSIPTELSDTLLAANNARIERIISHGHTSPADFWYDQDQDEWVLLLSGKARIAFVDQTSLELQTGDYVLIPAHTKHRVDWTCPDSLTVWLAVFLTPESSHNA